MERLTITIETGNDAVETRLDAMEILDDLFSGEWTKFQRNDSGIIRDINGNKIGEWKWEPAEKFPVVLTDGQEEYHAAEMTQTEFDHANYMAGICTGDTLSWVKHERQEVLEETFNRT